MKKKREKRIRIQVVLGSGPGAERMLLNMEKMAGPFGSVSKLGLHLIKKAEPRLMEGVENGK